MSFSEIRILVTVIAMLLLPGWAFLGATGLWRNWATLPALVWAAGFGIAFYPVFMYLARFLLPAFHLGTNKITALVVFFTLVVLFTLRKHAKEQFRFDTLVLTIFAILAAVFARVWMAHLYPIPAWSDSLHHTLLTFLTAQSGQLPYSLEPYAPVSLDMYHLGLYAITGIRDAIGPN